MSYTIWDNRYPLFDEMVAVSEHPAYITSKHPALDEWLRQRFSELGVGYVEYQIGDYHIFYDLTRTVRPVELARNWTSEP
jgi:hypothetical protein